MIAATSSRGATVRLKIAVLQRSAVSGTGTVSPGPRVDFGNRRVPRASA